MTFWIWDRGRSAAAFTLAGMLALLLFGNAGCGNKQLEDLAKKAQQGIDQAKQKASDVSQEVQKSAQNLPGAVSAVTAGEIKLTLDAPVSSSTCSARFTPPNNGRRGLLQIGTNVSSGPQSYPAIYLHAPTDATTLQGLVGQTVQGELFVAKSESNGHFQSTAEKPVSVQIVKLENNVVTCQLQAAELNCLDQPQIVPVAGTLIGAVRP